LDGGFEPLLIECYPDPPFPVIVDSAQTPYILFYAAKIKTKTEAAKLNAQNMPRRPKFDYDGDDFYDEVLALAMQGMTDAEIADALADKLGDSLSPERFNCMKNGTYEAWTDEENKRRSERLCKVLARGRRKTLAIVRGAYLKAALGGKKIHSKTVVHRRLRIDGQYTDDEEIQTSESEQELPYNVQALATFLYHHDPEWRKIERKLDTDASDIPTDIRRGVDVEAWIRKEAEDGDD